MDGYERKISDLQDLIEEKEEKISELKDQVEAERAENTAKDREMKKISEELERVNSKVTFPFNY
jgi:chromosome segregation ATPase